MRQLRLDIDRNAMERDPAPQPYADRGDLVLVLWPLVRPPDPDADAVLAPLAADVEGGQGPDDPFLQRRDIGPDIGAPTLQIEHHVSHALAGAVIGDLAAAPGHEQGKTRLKQVASFAARAGSVERGVLQEPYHLRRFLRGDRSGPRLHRADGLRIGDLRIGN